MSKRLLVDVDSLYAHSRDKLVNLRFKGKRTGGIFGVVKTVDAATRRYTPDVVVLCFSDGGKIYLDDDALRLGVWGRARGFHVSYMRGGTSAETIKKVTTDLISQGGDSDILVQSWDTSLHGLLADNRVSYFSLSTDPLFTSEKFKEEHGMDVRFLARSQQIQLGDIASISPDPNIVTLTSFLDDNGFDSILEEVKAGDVRLIESRAISL